MLTLCVRMSAPQYMSLKVANPQRLIIAPEVGILICTDLFVPKLPGILKVK